MQLQKGREPFADQRVPVLRRSGVHRSKQVNCRAGEMQARLTPYMTQAVQACPTVPCRKGDQHTARGQGSNAARLSNSSLRWAVTLLDVACPQDIVNSTRAVRAAQRLHACGTVCHEQTLPRGGNESAALYHKAVRCSSAAATAQNYRSNCGSLPAMQDICQQPLPLTGSSTAITSVLREPSALAAMLLMTVAFVKCRRSCRGGRSST